MPKYCENCKELVYGKGATHNHMFSLAFTVDSMYADELDCLKHERGEVYAKLLERVADIVRSEYDDVFDALGHEDTFKIERDASDG